MEIRAQPPEEPEPRPMSPPPGLPAPLTDPEVFPSPPDPIPVPDSTPIEAPVDPMELFRAEHRPNDRTLPTFTAWAEAVQRGGTVSTRTSRPARESSCISRSTTGSPSRLQSHP
jgi:hypothetical protein